MNEKSLFDNTKLAAYFLWEHTGCDNALNLWLCAEDIACFFEQTQIIETWHIDNILELGFYDPGYIDFVEHLAYRIFQYTGRSDEWHNWFAAERMLGNIEWVKAMTGMSSIYRKEQRNQSIMNDVRSENVRAYYDEQTLGN